MISSVFDMANMLYVKLGIYVNRVEVSFVKHGYLLNEPTCIN